MSSKARRPGLNKPASVEVREMELEDVHVVFKLGRRLFTADDLPTLYRSWDEHEVLNLFGADEEVCLIAETRQPSRIVGFALGSVMQKSGTAWRYGWLEWLGVDPRFKRQGIAARLLRRLTELFIERDVRIMLVDTDEDNEEALAFFRKVGFGQEIRHIYLSQNLEDHPSYVARRSSR